MTKVTKIGNQNDQFVDFQILSWLRIWISRWIFGFFSGYPVVNDPLYNHDVFGPEKGKGGRIGKSDEDLIQDLISIHNAENWLGMDQDDLIICNPTKKVTVTHHQHQPSSQPPQRADTPDSAVAISDHSPSSSSPASDFQVRLFHNLRNSPKKCLYYFLLKVDNVGTQVLSKHGSSLSHEEKVTIATQTGIEEADRRFDSAKLSIDPHCYECKVKYRDPRPKDLVMFLHAWTYSVS